MELKLNSLGGSEPVIYHWPYHFNDQGCEIIEAISFACEEEPPLTKYLDDILTGCVVSNYESMRIVCQKFNQAVDHLRSLVTSGLYEVQRRASYKLLHHVIQTCYNRAVVDPDKLNHYEPFSAEVYGETSFELVHQMIETIKFSENDQFIDLGSGVGHVVLQVAASTPCKSCYGIEKAHWPAIYAKQMGAEFDKWMKFYGKECGSHDLVKGNFLSDDFKDVISNATVIFVNNFAFGPQVDHELKLRFSNLKEGTKIVSSKAFCALNMQITERNLSDIGAILTVEELSPLRGPVSWTPKRITYYLHTIDRTQLEEYFKMRQNPNRRQKKSLTSIGNKINRKPEINYHSKMNKNTKIWRGNTMICNQPPPTINMISTITAMDSQTIPLCTKAKKALWNDSSDSISSNNPAYIFPSAHTLVFNESNALPNTPSKPVLLHGNSNADAEPVMNENNISPRKHYYFKNEATSKMGLVGKTPFSPLNPKDMFVGFCSDENDLSEEMQLEIENVISLFHNETSKISQKDGYKPSAIFNDLSILEDRTTQEDKRSEGSYSANGKKSLGVVSSSDNGDSKIENSKNQCLTPTVKMPKITVSLPRFSPITPETPSTFFESNGFKKCIPFPRLVKTNDLFVNNSFSNSVNTKACNQERVSDVPLKNMPRSTPLKSKSPSEELKPVTPSLTPACQPVSCRPVTLGLEHGNKQFSDFDEYSHGDHSPVQSIDHGKNLPVSQWDHSKVFTVSLPRKILDVSHLSTDESTPYSHNNVASNQANRSTYEEDDEDDIDPPELTFMMNTFRMQYKHLLKSMKHPLFKSQLVKDLEFQRNHQVFLYKTIFKLNNELCELQHQNKILFQSLMEKNNRQLHSSLHEAFPPVSNSPSVLDQAICLDSSQDISTSREYFNAQNDVKKINSQHNLNEFEKQPPSPEMPLLLPEICSNFENEQLIQHSKFTPPRLTVCVDEPKNPSYHLSNISSLPYHETNQDSVQTSPSHQICFSPISSCDTESPIQSPLPNDGDDKYSNAFDKMLPSESQLNNNIYYSSLSNAMKNDSYNSCSNIKFNNGFKVAFENSDTPLSFKKRKALEGASDHLLTSKRLQLSGGLLNQTYESTYDNVILRNVLHSKGQSNGPYIESRSDSRDSGFGKDCETDCEAANRLRVSKDAKELVEVPSQKVYIARQNYEASQINYQSLPIVPMTSSAPLGVGHSNLKENHYHIPARNNVFKHPNNQKQVCKFPLPAVNQDGSYFPLPGYQNPKLSGSYDLSFSSLANYYEKYLSQDSGAFVHDNLNNNSPNHFYLMRHNLSSAFT